MQVFTSDGEFLATWGSRGSDDGQFSTLVGVAVSPSGVVYVADHVNSRVQAFTEDGHFLWKWGSFGNGKGEFNSPFAIAVDLAGNVYVTEAHTHESLPGEPTVGNHRIQAFNAVGEFLTAWGTRGAGDGQFHSPFALAVGFAGNIYVADHTNGRVQVFEPGPLVNQSVGLSSRTQ